MRRFKLHRHDDVTGVSGTGIVAEGIVFSDGVTVIRWRGRHASTVVWGSIQSAIEIHGHGGATEFRWLDDAPATCGATKVLTQSRGELATCNIEWGHDGKHADGALDCVEWE